MAAKTKKNKTDWVAVELEYSLGASIPSLSIKHKVTRQAIMKQRDKNEWKQSLSDKIQKKVTAKVTGFENVTEDTVEAATELEANRRAKLQMGWQNTASRLNRLANLGIDIVEKRADELLVAEEPSINEIKHLVVSIKSLSEASLANAQAEARANGMDWGESKRGDFNVSNLDTSGLVAILTSKS
jgi:hypothetical protein